MGPVVGCAPERQLDQVLGGITAEPDAAVAARVLGELHGLAAIVESHFSFEERAIVAALHFPPHSASAVNRTKPSGTRSARSVSRTAAYCAARSTSFGRGRSGNRRRSSSG
ncbi:hypothetical protein [Amycolatopsis mediterranei]|uniref:hypothetical protein n=1 Tax=Amycolatopsis mediterranei TaxID=33910 RepID=UPI00331DA851